MCGIIGYVGKSGDAVNIALRGLEQLEYRGYDSAGLVCHGFGSRSKNCRLYKTVGRVENLVKKIGENPQSSCCAIAHTRWATHGVPSVKNAHPHYDCKKEIFLVHNGIIENYEYLKEALQREGHKFVSDTDTEVLTHLIERSKEKYGTLEDAVIDALCYVKGTFALAVISKTEPNKIIASRRSSPLIVGLGKDGYFLASDASALMTHTKKVVYLDDDEVAVLTPESLGFLDLKKNRKNKRVDLIDWDIKTAQKSGFPHFMLKEIHEQPAAIRDSLRGRLIPREAEVKLGGLEVLGDRLKEIERFVIASCGTSYYAGLIGEYIFEKYAGLPVEVDFASEFRYRNPVLNKNTAVLVISQSGETADTLAALRMAKKKGAVALGIVNTVGSSIARETDAGVYNHIGPEIGVASTKAFTSQVAVLALCALFFARLASRQGRGNNLSKAGAGEIIKSLYLLPPQLREVLKSEEHIKRLAKKYNKYNNFLFLGRKFNYPAAMEAALKLKEISYSHAEGYGAGEMKHGPIALIDENFPTIAIVGSPASRVYEKMISNLEEIKARRGPLVAVAEKGDKNISRLADDVIYIPKTQEALNPILAVVPLQLFAYYMAVLRGLDPDKPRNLAKSVTVE
ncbi:MAG: glutamine--fructose-6-phosphate transaminase (isomerizing) [Candidatus Tagabacteria bacterium CG09_land_8_20_14_0_10_41_14]|uniref:Glutamine--fructose-6-phosphate aminotransferase [isomerizing] n=1 Tax=Candidatus Tagabacteria bacterium CG09_land_8_20_14_0_10_41_14 TaxID=1975021 RepID=A0A2H0WM73_9BACT|nr:MAG: glutamine--fructose-6-phosphate transaminase (isomerizing) [Candidatus Tagabacteria bacterium CG09_land_8_20_14_0_10_41_14]